MATLEILANTRALEDSLDALVEDVERAARPAAQAGAQVLYDRVKQNVAGLGRVTGNLDSAIYQKFMEEVSRPGVARYRISWNHRKAPHAQLVEFGHMQYFKTYVGSDGKWHTRVRPEALGYRVVKLPDGGVRMVKDPTAQKIAKPKGRASYAEKSRYYDPLPTPKQVPARPFIRTAAAALPAALQAVEDRFFAELKREP